MTIEEKVKQFEKEYRELLKKYGLEMTMDMDFPQYKILPIRLQLALQIIMEEGIQYRATYKEVPEPKKEK